MVIITNIIYYDSKIIINLGKFSYDVEKCLNIAAAMRKVCRVAPWGVRYH